MGLQGLAYSAAPVGLLSSHCIHLCHIFFQKKLNQLIGLMKTSLHNSSHQTHHMGRVGRVHTRSFVLRAVQPAVLPYTLSLPCFCESGVTSPTASSECHLAEYKYVFVTSPSTFLSLLPSLCSAL